MFEVNCYDEYGGRTNMLTQWDINQTLLIKDTGLDVPPEAHFTNANMTESVKVSTILDENKNVIIEIPNFLLQQATPIILYIYYYSDIDSGRSVERIRIPVIKKNKPSEYKYVENIDITSATAVISEVDRKYEEQNKKIDDMFTGQNNEISNKFEIQNNYINNYLDKESDKLDEQFQSLEDEFRMLNKRLSDSGEVKAKYGEIGVNGFVVNASMVCTKIKDKYIIDMSCRVDSNTLKNDSNITTPCAISLDKIKTLLDIQNGKYLSSIINYIQPSIGFDNILTYTDVSVLWKCSYYKGVDTYLFVKPSYNSDGLIDGFFNYNNEDNLYKENSRYNIRLWLTDTSYVNPQDEEYIATIQEVSSYLKF